MAAHFGMPLVYVDAAGHFLEELAGVTDPEQKRKRIGETFMRVFEAHAASAGPFEFLAQGTLYPDVIESATPRTRAPRRRSRRITTSAACPTTCNSS